MKVVWLEVAIPDSTLDLPFLSAIRDINGCFPTFVPTDSANCKINFCVAKGEMVSLAFVEKSYSPFFFYAIALK